jgi:hypothetical protein
MSMQVPIEEIPQVAVDYGDSAYVLAGAGAGPPRITHSMVTFAEGQLVVTVGRRAAAAIAANAEVSVLWPATTDQSMSLIVDGRARFDEDRDGLRSGEVWIAPSGAVRHRPASG